MARYVVHVRTPKSPEAAFAYMADLTNFAAWDPGVVSADQVEGEGAGLGTAFLVKVRAVPGPIDLTYRTTVYEPPGRVVAVASNRRLTSHDTITVRPEGEGSIVSYDAELTLNGILRLADPLLGLVFGRIGDRAAAGLIEALEGERVDTPGG
jgi:carbon monoxide dehydrogenase subunit G